MKAAIEILEEKLSLVQYEIRVQTTPYMRKKLKKNEIEIREGMNVLRKCMSLPPIKENQPFSRLDGSMAHGPQKV